MNLEDALGGWPSGGNNQPQGGAWPGQPGQPTNPTWPGQPAQPTWPGQPGQPAQPTWPGQPGQPAQPTWPGQPGQPAQPTWPGQPGQPTQPAWPGQPGSPPSPPSPPGWPGQPGQPGQPGPIVGPGFGPVPSAPGKNMAVPYSQTLPNGIFDKLLITIVGTIKTNPDKITVDLSTHQDLAFHFNPRFNENGRKVIVRNSCLGKKWGKEERDLSGNFPFAPGQQFEMKIMCTNKEFKVAVNNHHLLTFHHRISNLRSINKLSIHNDLNLSDVRMESMP
ncbi:LOW QUALITY PROTEIN: galectin-3b [Anoplopoma fimbria]|uniref:LOW QUALITY PROTEIN: galectin-3b n=1 Tax=Anoplopoma fimbria TaxID=229290 RepID=UPI0023ED2D47|nr:LOW QUALITY PROTEIN: galectin-3b [Anoplopoma fimbria]